MMKAWVCLHFSLLKNTQTFTASMRLPEDLFMPCIISVELCPVCLCVYAVFYSVLFFSPFLSTSFSPPLSVPAPSFPGQISLVRCVPMKRPSWRMCHVTTTPSQANRRWAQTDISQSASTSKSQSNLDWKRCDITWSSLNRTSLWKRSTL